MNQLLPLTILCSLLCPILPGQGIRAFKFEIETLGGQKRNHDDFKNKSTPAACCTEPDLEVPDYERRRG